MIKFSIITVCLNAGEDLLYTINNILEQEYSNYEIVVKDGLSKDGSVGKLPDNEHIHLIQCKDRSVYDAMNQAIDVATGDYCLFINAGDGLYEPSTLRQIADFINLNDGDFYYGKSNTISSGVINYGPANIDKFFCYRTTMCHQAVVIRAQYLKKRGYDINYKISADREWMVYAFVEAGMKFVRMPIMVSNYKGGGISYGNKIIPVIRGEAMRINRTHFTVAERLKFGLMRAATLPNLRGAISRNPKFKSMYFKVRYKFLSR